MEKEGRKQKDALIVDGFNQKKRYGGPGGAAIRAAKLEVQRLLAARARQATALKRAEAELAKVSPVGVVGVEVVEDREDTRSAEKMLADLRYGYRNALGPAGTKGRTRLLELMASDAEFKFVVRELVKVEAALLAAKARKGEDGPGVNQSVFVVLKGLESDKAILAQVESGLDLKQISQATNPDGSEVVND